MKEKCLKCGGEVAENAPTGRPKSYCSVGCRRAAGHEIGRINSRLGKLEGDLSNARIGWGWQPLETAQKLELEIAVQEARLRALLNLEESS